MGILCNCLVCGCLIVYTLRDTIIPLVLKRGKIGGALKKHNRSTNEVFEQPKQILGDEQFAGVVINKNSTISGRKQNAEESVLFLRIFIFKPSGSAHNSECHFPILAANVTNETYLRSFEPL